jgi:hypothetical protein
MNCPHIPQYCLNILLRHNAYLNEHSPSANLEPRLTLWGGGGGREPGTHCLCMRKVCGAFSSIIRHTLSLPRGQTRMDKVHKTLEVCEA